MTALEAEPDLVVGDNEPYLGGLEGDTIDRHAVRRGLPNALIEVRQDLIATEAEAERWAERLAALAPILADSSSREVQRFARVARTEPMP
jgi:predicted N-formylglutamate amidohydrolase